MTAPYSIYKAFEADDIVVADAAEVTTGMWSGNTGSLNYITASLTQISSSTGDYFIDVYDLPESASGLDDAEVQFSIAYGHIDGGGYPTLTEEDLSMEPTKATYCQYRNILLDPTDTLFTFGTYSSRDIYVVNIKRARLREKLDPGNWYIPLSGSAGRFTFIDDSGQSLGSDHGKSGRVFNIVSGALGGPDGFITASNWASATKGNYGLAYPDLGILVFNPNALAETVGSSIAPETASVTYKLGGNKRNYLKLYNSILKGYLDVGSPESSASADFQARSAETISSTHYFVRLRNKEFNYTNNPTFFDPATGTLKNTDNKQNPRVYITSVGLYNGNNECVAIGKVSSPLPKGFDKEVLIRCRLDF